jgi:hypothetical protein
MDLMSFLCIAIVNIVSLVNRVPQKSVHLLNAPYIAFSGAVTVLV